jgi:hypothetical protein
MFAEAHTKVVDRLGRPIRPNRHRQLDGSRCRGCGGFEVVIRQR